MYTGTYGNSSILKIDTRTSSIVGEIRMPSQVITTPVFGGPDLDELFVASGKFLVDLTTGTAANSQPSGLLDGSLFRIVGLGAKGWAGRRACV